MRYLLCCGLFLFVKNLISANLSLVDLYYGPDGVEFNDSLLERLVGADPHNSFSLVKTVEIGLVEKLHRYRQHYRGVPIFGASLAVKESRKGRIVSIYGPMMVDIEESIKTKSRFDE